MNSQQSANFSWACGLIRDAIEKGMYGSITLTFRNGGIETAKTETMAKPPVDKAQGNA